ncbi:zinc ribbon domain-containing protein [Novipirellula galeiformis]|uniref:zinc ribbon domain-containing protein n=1 Tax=Novipirellula galeiformis TaxID=2528004 RepID=UPI0018CFB9AF|nr:zinc ribbon domain-containing protein [Novipirellula galeiformis]
MKEDSTFSCPHCGAELRGGATFCRHCGSSDDDGWKTESDEVDGEDDFDYEEFVREEFSDNSVVTSKLKTWQVIVILLILASMSLWVLG